METKKFTLVPQEAKGTPAGFIQGTGQQCQVLALGKFTTRTANHIPK